MTSSAAPWTVRVLTLFPEIFPGPLAVGLLGKALGLGLWSLSVFDIRSFATGKHGHVDAPPFGGGPGMILRVDVLDAALTKITGGPQNLQRGRVIYLSPRGLRIDQQWIQGLSTETPVTLLCGRYEGIDERVIEVHQLEEVSLGDFVLSCGEFAAFAVIDACVRLLPGVTGNIHTTEEESFVNGLLEYPHYTKPAVWTDLQGHVYPVPEVLRCGHHQQIQRWRRQQAEYITRKRRPDLWYSYTKTSQLSKLS